MLTFDDLRNANTQRCRESFDGVAGWSVLEWAGAACAALGKAADLSRRMRLGEPVDPDRVMRELATALIYIDNLAAYIGGDLGDATREEFNRKTTEIGSPIRL